MDYSSKIYIVKGIIVTLQYTVLSLIFGGVLGTGLALIQLSGKKKLSALARLYISIFRGTPLLVQLSLIYFAMPGICGIKLSAFTAGIIAFSLNSAAYIAEIIRGGIQSIDKGQFSVCKSLGIPYYLQVKDIILPQAIRYSLPALVNEMISLLKETAIISIIGEADIMRRANMVAAEHYTYFKPLIIAAICYYILVITLSHFGKQLENRVNYDTSK